MWCNILRREWEEEFRRLLSTTMPSMPSTILLKDLYETILMLSRVLNEITMRLDRIERKIDEIDRKLRELKV